MLHNIPGASQFLKRKASLLNILAIETSTRRASVAVAIAGRAVVTIELPVTRQTASWLNEAVDAALRKSQLGCHDIELLGMTVGPGSFTGLRIAVTFAKLFCYSTAAALVALDTLDVIAHQAAASVTPPARLHVIMDAMRRELFYAAFQVGSSGTLQRETATAIVKQADFLQQLDASSVVCGPATPLLHEQLPVDVSTLDDCAAYPHATAVAHLALEKHRQGQHDDIWKLVPLYYRKSYAEE
jgi:tRNA threonylcarbamoyladenosine biosynthesis protein TsaB